MDTFQKKTVIKEKMPEVYAAIHARAAAHGKEVWGLVTRALEGEPNCFYAMEAGHVMGTPFELGVTPEVAQLMVQFGVTHMVMWPPSKETLNGAN